MRSYTYPMDQPLKFILAPMGSAGDVHPLLWLARLLQSRGPDVAMVMQSIVAELAEKAGVPFIPVGDKVEQEAVVRHPHLWHPRKAFPLIAKYMPLYAREMMPVLHRQVDPGRSIFLAGSLAFGAR